MCWDAKCKRSVIVHCLYSSRTCLDFERFVNRPGSDDALKKTQNNQPRCHLRLERPFRGSSWGTPIQIVGMDPIPSTLKFKFKLVWYGCYLCSYFNCNKTKRILLLSLLKLPVLTKQNIETFHSKGEQVGKCVQPGWFVHGGSSRAGLKITSLRARIFLQSILQLNTSVQVKWWYVVAMTSVVIFLIIIHHHEKYWNFWFGWKPIQKWSKINGQFHRFWGMLAWKQWVSFLD